MSDTRKLAAILVADVVGYSRLAGADEERTLARLRALRSDLIDPSIALHRGRIVKLTGDGSIIEFRSVVDAVRCAIEVQTGMVERNAGLPPDKRIEFRVGVHLGDVVEEADGDLMGDGVNIAARLEGIAKPGAICLSEDAYRQVKQRLNLKVNDLGATHLKNIAEPIRVYSLDGGAGATTPSALATVKQERGIPVPRTGSWTPRRPALAAALAALLVLVAAGAWYVLGGRLTKPAQAGHLSIVVLPFTNLSGDPSQDYFADGITENLDHRPLSPQRRLCHRAQYGFRLQGQGRRRQGDRQGTWRSLRAGRFSPARSEPGSRQRAADRRRKRRSSVGRALR